MNEQLNKYVLDARASGLGDVDINKALIVAGWNKVDVDMALDVAPATITPQQNESLPPTSDNISKVGNSKPKRKWLRNILICIAVLIVLLVIVWFFPYPHAKTPTLDSALVNQYSITRSISNGDLGISITSQTGNTAEDFIHLVGQPARPETQSAFWEKHRGQTEETAILDDVDKQDLTKLVSNGTIQLKLPENVLEIPNMVLPSMATIRQISRIISRTSRDLASKGQYDEAENWLHLTIALGRNLEDGSASLIQWLVGVAVEKEGTTALQDVLLKEGKTEQAAMAGRNLKDLEKQRAASGAKTAVEIRLIQTSAMFYQITFGKIPAGALPVHIWYTLQGIPRQQFLSELVALKSIHDERYFTDDVLPLAILAHIPIEPERTLATEVIDTYAKSSRADIRQLAESAMSITSDQISQWLKQSTGSALP